MQIITLTTDFGNTGFHLANLKSSIYSAVNNVIIEEITHFIRKSDLNETAFILENSIVNFPPNSLHICPIIGKNQNNFPNYNTWLLVKFHHQFVLCLNNGLFSLFSSPGELVNVFESNLSLNEVLKQIFKNFPPKLEINNFKFNELTPIKPVFDGKQLLITIVHIDSKGNTYTNLKKSDFELIIGNDSFEIQIKIWDEFRITQRRGIYKISKIYTTEFEIKENEIFALFDQHQNLMIGYGYGDAEKLLGIKINDTIIINKNDNTDS